MITTKLHLAFNSPVDNDVDGITVDQGKLLSDLVDCNWPLIRIANDHGLNLAQLIAWASQKPIRDLLDAADEIANRIAAHKAAQGRTGVIQTLIGQATGLCETTREQEIASRAARSVLRYAAHADRKPRKPRNPGKRIDKLKAILDNAGSYHPAPATPRTSVRAHSTESRNSASPPPFSEFTPGLVGDLPESAVIFPVYPLHDTTSRIGPISPIGPMSPVPDLPPANGHHENGSAHPP